VIVEVTVTVISKINKQKQSNNYLYVMYNKAYMLRIIYVQYTTLGH